MDQPVADVKVRRLIVLSLQWPIPLMKGNALLPQLERIQMFLPPFHF
jgi:hypothetical protein